MDDIVSWGDLLNLIEKNDGDIFRILEKKILRCIKKQMKTGNDFLKKPVGENFLDIFNNFKLIYTQLFVEDDIIDINVTVGGDNNRLTFPLMGNGKFIKIYSGNPTKLFFYDPECTILSDKSITDFLERKDKTFEDYSFFGQPPLIYYKFKTLPSAEVLQYLESHGVYVIEYNTATEKIIISD